MAPPVKDIRLDPKKYIVIKTEIFEAFNEPYPTSPEQLARLILKHPEAVIDNTPGAEDEHFVMMLKDVNVRPALIAYARSATAYTMTLLGQGVQALAERAGILSNFQKFPD